jgi:hypothetical protein
MAKKAKEPEPAEEIIQAEPPASEIVAVPEAPIEQQVEPPVEAAPPPSDSAGPTLGQRVKRFLVFLLRLVMILIILVAVAVGLAYSVPLLYQKYVQPVQDNSAQLEQLKTRVAQNEIAIAGLQSKLEAVQTEQAQQAQSLSELDGKVLKIEEQIAAHTETLSALDQVQTMLQAKTDATDAEVTRQIKLMKSMELLSRARLFMYQSNFGLARQDVQIARDLLAEIQPTAPEPLATELAEVIRRLDLTLANLPNFPVAASDDLDIAWQILLAGIPEPQATPLAETPATETPIPELTATPTPNPTVEPTATP